jgi:uncharacterized protein
MPAQSGLDELHIMRYTSCVMTNPFEYGRIVGSDAFCNRTQELADILRAMSNGDNLFIYSERRMGKTSLVKKALSALPKSEFNSVYVDLWPTDSESTFISVFAKAVTQGFESTPDKMLQFGKDFFSSLRPTVSLDSQGSPQIGFGMTKDESSAYSIEEVLEVPATVAKKRKKKVVIVLDELQQILEYKSDIVERRLRSVIQKQDDVAFIFLGSRKHLIQKMFSDRNRPLYRSGGHYPLSRISLKHWRPFIIEKFSQFDRVISEPIVDSIISLTDGHPYYTQHLSHAIWEQTSEASAVSQGTIAQALHILLDREDYAFSTLWDSLASNQRKMVEALAAESTPVKVYSASFVKTSGLGTPSACQRVVAALQDRDLVDHESGSYFISERFFRLWLRRKLGLAQDN